MNRFCTLLLTAALCLSLSGCGPSAPPEPPEKITYSYEGTIFTYGDQCIDFSERFSSITAILSITPVGDSLVIDCHAGPKNGFYAIFDIVSQTITAELVGNHLIWHSDDLTTAVYAFWNEVYTWDGTLLWSFDLEENAFIQGLAFTEDHTALTVSISHPDGSEQAETLPL